MDTILYVVIEAGTLLGVYVLGELFSHHVLFRILNERFIDKGNQAEPSRESDTKDSQGKFKSMAQQKGHFERAMLVLGMAAGFPQILIAFGALKVGTFVRDNGNAKVSSDYYLIGNVVSISIAIIYTVLWRELMTGFPRP